MNSKSTLRLLLVIAAVFALTACDRSKSTDTDTDNGTLAGLWLNSGGYDDFYATLGSADEFCDLITAKGHSYHAAGADQFARPRVLEVTPDGRVIRWESREKAKPARVSLDPVIGIDRLRLTGLNSMVRRGGEGDETFTRIDEKTALAYSRRVKRCQQLGWGPAQK